MDGRTGGRTSGRTNGRTGGWAGRFGFFTFFILLHHVHENWSLKAVINIADVMYWLRCESNMTALRKEVALCARQPTGCTHGGSDASQPKDSRLVLGSLCRECVNLVKQLNNDFPGTVKQIVILRDSQNDSNGLRNIDLELQMDPVILS